MPRLGLAALVFLLSSALARGDDGAAIPVSVKAAVDAVQVNLNIVWVVAAAVLVFFMQAGFAALDALGGQVQVTTGPHRGTTIKMLVPAVLVLRHRYPF